MNPTGTSEIQQALAACVAARPYSHRQDVAPEVTAVITAEEDLRFFPDTMAAVLTQDVLPGNIVVVDCTGSVTRSMVTRFDVIHSSSGPMTDIPPVRTVDVRLVGVENAASFGDAVTRGLRQAHITGPMSALWLLHDDSRPADAYCLARLLDTWHNNPTASMLGAKQLDWAALHLHDVGSYMGRHRLESLVVDGEEDQEQYDSRQDVFAVSMAGALLPVETLQTVGGIDRWPSTFAQSADLCRRICLGGGRVVVVPSARIAHRRSRFEGIRTRTGEALDEREPANVAMSVLDGGRRYRCTDIRIGWWPLLWVWRLLCAVGLSLTCLFSKKPFEAWCELCMPFRALVDLARMIPARRLVAKQTRIPPSRLTALGVTRQQVRRWRERRQAFDDQRHVILLSPLAKAHLRARRIRRWSLAGLMALLSFAVVAVLYRDVFMASFAGGSLYSAQLIPTGADFGQLVDAATTSWNFGAGTGVPAPPTPWLLVWLVVSLATLGNAGAALSVMFFAAAPLSALSFWALSGIFTRSNAVRVASGSLWVALSMAMGLYDAANLPMLTVMVFLPASFAFVFRAVGLYHTEDQLHPHRSVQSAALAALCFIPVVAAEPQLLLPLIVLFLTFLVFVPRHRVMLLLMPLPAAFVVAPTLVNAVRYAHEGVWRQLFGDAMMPSHDVNGGPGAVNLFDVAARAFGSGSSSSSWFVSGVGEAAIGVVMVLLIVVAVIALFLPFALRVSRMMWMVVVMGGALSVVCTRIVIFSDAEGDVAASVLPGFALLLLGLLSCAGLVAGGAVKRFVPLRASSSAATAHAQGPARIEEEKGSSRRNDGRAKAVVIRCGRAALVVGLALATLTGVGFTVTRPDRSTLGVSESGLPMVAVDYLQQGADHRILALKATSQTSVEFTVMRTGRGDLVDSSAVTRVRIAHNGSDTTDKTIAAACASLLTGTDAQAIEQISQLGFGGIFVVSSDGDAESAGEQLRGNITASDGTQSVVANDNGTYYRLTINSADTQNIDTAWQQRTQHSRWRYIWLWSAGIIVAMYCLVALPRRVRIHDGEES